MFLVGIMFGFLPFYWFYRQPPQLPEAAFVTRVDSIYYPWHLILFAEMP